jgi:hypothetical protein
VRAVKGEKDISSHDRPALLIPSVHGERRQFALSLEAEAGDQRPPQNPSRAEAGADLPSVQRATNTALTRPSQECREAGQMARA